MFRIAIVLVVALALGIVVASAQEPRLFGYRAGAGAIESEAAATAFRREMGCYQFSLDAIERALASGRLAGLETGPVRWRQRACTIIAMCDVIDGEANLFARIEAVATGTAPRRRTDLSHCAGVDEFGPALIERERDLFAIVERFR